MEMEPPRDKKKKGENLNQIAAIGDESVNK